MIEDSHREELQDVQADEHEKLCLFTSDNDIKVIFSDEMKTELEYYN